MLFIRGIRTKVKREVFPEPLGPMSKMEGRVVRPLARKTNEWRKMGMVSASNRAMAKAVGDGLIRACTHSVIADMVPRNISKYLEIPLYGVGVGQEGAHALQGFGRFCVPAKAYSRGKAGSSALL